jgi:hypothetical protein
VHALNDLSQGTTIDLLHGEIDAAILEAPDFVHGHNAGVLQLRRGLSFFDKPSNGFRVCDPSRSQNFHRHHAIESAVTNPTNLAHGALSNLPEIFVIKHDWQVQLT